MIYGKYCVRNSVLLDYVLQLYKINYKRALQQRIVPLLFEVLVQASCFLAFYFVKQLS